MDSPRRWNIPVTLDTEQAGPKDDIIQVQSLSEEEEEEEEALWEKIESVRHQLTRSLNPEKLTPYLRQCRVIDEQDEEEVLSAYRFPCRSNRTGLLMDILRRRGKRGYEAFLESLEFYYPEHFTRLTGKQPVQRCSMILDEEGPEGLTQFLMMEVKKVRAQRKEHLAKEHQLQIKNQGLEKECSQLKQQLQGLQKVQEGWQRFQEEWDTKSLELLRLKDENYLLAMRFAQLCEEKNAAVLRSRDLQLGIDQLKCKIASMEEECSLLKKQTLMTPQREMEDHGFTDISDLQAENQRLIASLQELQNAMQKAREDHVPGSERVLLDILEHDWKEAQADRQELCQKLSSLQNELQCAEQLRDKYLQEMEDLQLKFHTLQKNCDLYKHRMNTVLSQLEEIEKERDQAIQSRDDIQLQYSQSLIEKDQYRKRVRTLEEERDDLLSKLTQAEGTLEGQLQRCLCNRGLAKKICSSSHSLYSSSWSIIEDGIVDSPDILDIVIPRDSVGPDVEVTPDREKEINRLSIFPFPPCAGSILRRQREDGPTPFKSWSYGSFGSMEDLTGSTTTTASSARSPSSSSSAYTRAKSEACLSSDCDQQKFARRSVMVHLSNTSPLRVPALQSRGLIGDISILGGNRTGIYVQWVKPGSEAEKAGLREGCRLLELREAQLNGEGLSLENCTLEVAHLSLLYWKDPSALLFSHDARGYQPLKEASDSRKKILGDSFYVRTNLSLLELSNPYALCVKCREILHVTDTLYKGQLEWYCARVDPFTLRDLDKGTVPNYNRAYQLLKIQIAMWQKSCRNKLKKRTLKQLRLVKLKKQDENPWLDSCPAGVEKPYSLVHPVMVQTRRPVMLSPGCLAPLLLRNLLDLPSSRQDFCFIPADNLAKQRAFCASSKNVVNAERLSQNQRDCGMIHMIQEAIKKNQHCLLELEVQLVKDLIKSEIYPIIIYVKVTEKKIKGIRSLLGKPGQRESEVLKKCQRDEWVLHTLPCLWVWVDPQSWSSSEDLVKVVRAHIFQEQTRMVWIEENDM
ncbi:caspase recruitment domain-containing protein 10 [Crotalus tigris]|uniref:caspase recruitment domain-containing protein 10 n=1 Tax=Crotalus tigris TaxID=88082 RepID=UPI00192F8F70|nr:caspase recruitment domain-containing protein 10 [Crotalus tigris]XP_039189553.1 caspase recruitment domain-containing protein 10 [Crotalus tigris]XP_039189554.1 caspase recruitment domain-containing protein 10 [Crotalus tigris]XP_039189555.1 caspase recruitment domain-containing protein 10 [Crotalus tigris]XP_039189556.1 caspase recruitment domain-containing protein 10 [Crotalus tigris]XP_039189557.1 caspase recruitment domain-containing protein 10 [Crotalus tigris]XP_039189558.1 caspase 